MEDIEDQDIEDQDIHEEDPLPQKGSTKKKPDSPGPSSKKRGPSSPQSTPPTDKKKRILKEKQERVTPKTYKTYTPSHIMYAKNEYVFRSHSSTIMVTTNDLQSLHMAYRKCTTESSEDNSSSFREVLKVMEPRGWTVMDADGNSIDTVSYEKMFTYIVRRYNYMRSQEPIQ